MVTKEQRDKKHEYRLNYRSWIAVTALMLFALGCERETESLTEPAPTTPQLAESAAPLAFWQISAGGSHTCGVTTTNQAYCWGANLFGQLGSGNNTGPEFCTGDDNRSVACSTRPLAVARGLRFLQVSAGAYHTCGVTTEHRLYCWGRGGSLGDGTTRDRYVPVAVAGGRLYRQVDAGRFHTCAASTGNRAFCWGNNASGQLGDGTTTQRLTSTAVVGGLSFRQVSVASGRAGSASDFGFTCGTTTDNRAFCWGDNRVGQLGDGTARRRLRPSRVAGGRLYRQVDAGALYACGVTTGSRAFCWGNGALGNGNVDQSLSPRAVAGGHSFDRVTAGFDHTCAESTSNRAYCWGNPVFGKLGDGTERLRETPVAVAGGLFFEQLSAGEQHTCGKAAGKGYCWGNSYWGQLGNGSKDYYGALSPVPVAGPS